MSPSSGAGARASQVSGREAIVSDWDPFLREFLEGPPPPPGAAEIRASRAAVLSAGSAHEAVDVVVGTISACHGAVSIPRLGPSRR